MNHAKIKELSIKFKANLFITKIREEIKNRNMMKGYNIGNVFSNGTQRN